MNVKCKRLKGFLLLFLTVLLCGSNLTAYADSSVADWCTVRISQKGGRARFRLYCCFT